MNDLLFGFVWVAPWIILTCVITVIFEHFDRTPEEEPKENGEF